MTDITIPALPAGSTPATTSVFESVEAGASVKYTLAQMKAFVVGPGSVNVTTAKTLTVTNSLTLSGTDGSTLNMGAGGTLGTAATQNTGTSGTNVPLLNGVNTWAGDQTFNGNVGIGMTPAWSLDITKTQASPTLIQATNADANGSVRYRASNGTAFGDLLVNGSGLVQSGVFRANGVVLTSSGSGGLTLNATGQPIYFGNDNTEHMRIDTAGNVLVGNAAQLFSEKLLVSQPVAAAMGVVIANTNTVPSVAQLLGITLSASAPNDSGALFINCTDNTTSRFNLRSNGGIANYSANNVNLSDANVKDQITPYSTAELAALEQSFTNVIWGKFKYKDQTHDDWNHGPTAQGVERAFGKTAPELVDESELGAKPESGVKHKVIYETDLTHIAHALLAKALKEIEELKAEVKRLRT